MDSKIAYCRRLFDHWNTTIFQANTYSRIALELYLAALSTGDLELEQKESAQPGNTMVFATP